MHFENDRLVIDRERSNLDDLVLEFLSVLEAQDVEYVVVAGYVAILTGRSRATEDVDLIIEQLSADETEQLATALSDAGYWGIEEDLERMYDRLTDDIATRVARDGEIIPNFEVAFPQDRFDRIALRNALLVVLDDREIRVSPPELQIAYKLYLGSEKDFEDALHLYHLFGEQLETSALETYVEELGVEDRYDELRGT
jgi:hypothetical protein